MNITPPVLRKAFQSHLDVIRNGTVTKAKEDMKACGEELCKLHKDQQNTENDSIDIGVSCDGSWARRGFSFLYGLVAVMSVDTRKVIDYHSLQSMLFL